MAEIRVEPKRGGGAKWLVIVLLLLALAALAYWWFVVNGGATVTPADAADTARTSSAITHVIERAGVAWRAPVLT